MQRGETHINESRILDSNQLGSQEGLLGSRPTKGRSGLGRNRSILGFMTVLEQSMGGCLNWGKGEVIGATKGRKGWCDCCLGGWRKCSP